MRNWLFIFALLLGNNLTAQIRVSGCITNNKSEPISNCKIFSATTQIPVFTNAEGKYTIEIQNNDTILYFQHRNFNTQKTNITNDTIINAVLDWYSTEYIFLTETELFQQNSNHELGKTLSSPFFVRNFSGQPNNAPDIFKYGFTTFSGNCRPEFYINNTPIYSGSTAIYTAGSDQTTALFHFSPHFFQGIKEKNNTLINSNLSDFSNSIHLILPIIENSTKVTVFYNYGVSKQLFNKKMLTATEYLNLRREGVLNDSVYGFLSTAEPIFDALEIYNPEDENIWLPITKLTDLNYSPKYKGYSNTNWQNFIEKEAIQQTLFAEIQKKKVKFSVEHFSNNGILKTFDFERNAAILQTQQTFFHNLNVHFFMVASNSKTLRNNGFDHVSGVYAAAMLMPPIFPLQNYDSSAFFLSENGHTNPAAIVNFSRNSLTEYRLLPSVNINYNILQNKTSNDQSTQKIFTMEHHISTDVLKNEEYAYVEKGTSILRNDFGVKSNSHFVGVQFLNSFNIEIQKVTSVANLKIQSLYENENIHYATHNGMNFNKLNTHQFEDLETIYQKITYNHQKQKHTTLLMFEFLKKQKYCINFSANYKNFLSLEKSVLYPKITTQFYLSKISIFQKTNSLFTLQYETVPNTSAIENILFPNLFSTQNHLFSPTYELKKVSIEKLQPENNNIFSATIETSFLHEQINMQLTYFHNKTKNAIVPEKIFDNETFFYQPINEGEIINSGVRIAFESTFWQKDNLRLDIQTFVTFQKNIINHLQQPYYNEFSIEKKGEAVHSFYLIETNGIYQTNSEIPQWKYELGVRAGDINFVDKNGDNLINANDRTVCGSAMPTCFGNFQLQLSILNKVFILSNINWGTGFSIYDYAAQKSYINTNSAIDYNRSGEALQRWTFANGGNTVPRASFYDYAGNFRTSDFFLKSGNYVTVSNVEISFQQKITTDFAAILFFSVNNLWTSTKSEAASESSIFLPVNIYNYPMVRTISGGLKFVYE